MLNIVLYEPEIPPNTGNIIRLCANTGAQLHVIEPMRFSLTDKHCRRAGLDYHEWARVQQYPDYPTFLAQTQPERLFACSTKGTTRYDQPSFQENDYLLFGPETRGLPDEILTSLPKSQVLRIPMRPHNRSLNLANAVSIILYEAWRQLSFVGAHSKVAAKIASPQALS